MSVQALIRARLIIETGMFEFIVQSEQGGMVTLQLPPDQFLEMVKYLGKVSSSYIDWMKSQGK